MTDLVGGRPPESLPPDAGVSAEQEAYPNAPMSTAPANTTETGALVIETPGPEHIGGGWYVLPNGDRVRGKKAAQARFDKLTEGAEKTPRS